MTALVGQEVERTFSGVARYLTGLASTETHEASGQNVGYLVEPLGGREAAGIEGVVHRRELPVVAPSLSSDRRANFSQEVSAGILQRSKHPGMYANFGDW
jgi:hypothetical protein